MDEAAWDAQYAGSESVWGSEPNRFVREQCERLPVGKAIDLACGEGRNALWLARLGWRVIGVDFSKVAIDRARELGSATPAGKAKRLTWRVEDVTKTQQRPNSFDLAVVSYLHVPAGDRDDLLTRASEWLRPHGHLVIVGHDRRNLAEGVSGPQDIELLYEPGHLRGVLVAADLVVEVASTVERPTASGIALDTVVRARRKANTLTVRGQPTR